jgi:replication factor C large subunit
MREEWTEKYRPGSLSEVVGNDDAVRTMRRWAETWQKGVPKKRALVLRGEPGTGKTSSALALAKDLGWDVIEMNASDHRNADAIRRVAGMGAVSQTFSTEGEFLTTAKGGRKLIVLDEADNLFGREDYGGARAIVETIRETSQPMILIVNDYYALTRKASAVKTLATSVVFHRLNEQTIKSVLERLCYEEGVDVDAGVLRLVAGNAGGDLRGAINDLQMLIEGKTHVGASDADALGKRNQLIEVDAFLREMFGARTARDARNAALGVDKTPEELILWIEENIPLEFRSPAEMTQAFDALSRSDIYLRRTRLLQHYGLWSYAKEMMTSGVAMSRLEGRRYPPSRYSFPGYLIMMSRSKGTRASRAALCSKLGPYFHTSSRQTSISILPYLRSIGQRDKEVLVAVGIDANLDEEDMAFLLGEDSGSEAVDDIFSEMRRRRTGEEEAPDLGKRKPSAKRRKSLADF